MKFVIWLSLIGIVTFAAGSVRLMLELGNEGGRHSSYGIYVMLAGAALVFVPWAVYGVSVL